MGFGDFFDEGDTVFCSYRNDDETTRSGFFILVNISEQAITLKTVNGNLIFIPIARILKLKKEVKE